MTVAKHGVSTDTPDRLLIDAGAVYTATDGNAGDPDVAGGGTLLGATRGGSVFEVNRTIRRMDPDGAKGPVKGFRRVEEVVATLTVNLLEITEENLLKALPGSPDLSGSTHIVKGAEIDDDDYIGSVAIVGTITGFDGTTKPIICRLLNVLVDGPFSVPMSPKDEAVVSMVFTAHFADSDLDTEPWEIEYPS